MDRNEIPLNIYLDLSKAFDSLDHNILLEKFKHYGIQNKSLELLRSYLTNRYQYVTFDNKESNLLPIKIGVPQGSILGPLLFIIYINDMVYASELFKPIIYADDTTLLTSIRTAKAIDKYKTESENINIELSKVTTWLQLNKLSLNCEKTKAMIFHTSQRIS